MINCSEFLIDIENLSVDEKLEKFDEYSKKILEDNPEQALKALNEMEKLARESEKTQYIIKSLQGKIIYHLAKKEIDQADIMFDRFISLIKIGTPSVKWYKDYNWYAYQFYKNGQHHKAIEIFELSLEVAKQNNTLQIIIGVLGNIGLVYSKLGNFTKASEYFQKCLKEQKEINDIVGVARTLLHLAEIEFKKENNEIALDYYFQANKQMEILEGDLSPQEISMKSSILNNIGNVYQKLEDYENALQFYTKSYDMKKSIQENELHIFSCLNIATTYQNLDKPELALKFFHKGLELCDKYKYDTQKAIILQNMGNLYYTIDELSKALDLYLKCEKMRRNQNDPSGLAYTLCNLAEIYTELKDYKKAEIFLTEAEDISTTHDYSGLLIKTYDKFVKLYSEQNMKEKAFDYLQKYTELSENLNKKNYQIK